MRVIVENFKKVVFENYANFRGRARRSEFWYFVLAHIIIAIAVTLIEVSLGLGTYKSSPSSFEWQGGPLSVLLTLLMFIPSLAVSARRLQDTNRSPFFLFLAFIPLIGAIILIVFYCQEGTKGTNNYGKDPKNPEWDIEDHLMD